MNTRWQALTPREQRSVSMLAVALGALAVWFIGVAPALNTLQESTQRREQLAQQHAHLLGLQAKAQALQKQSPLARDEALRRLQSITAVPGLFICHAIDASDGSTFKASSTIFGSRQTVSGSLPKLTTPSQRDWPSVDLAETVKAFSENS